MIEIKQATTEEEKLEITKLRYQIYVDEMKVYKEKADHKKGVLSDELDATNRLLYASKDSNMIGAISLVMGSDAPIPNDLAHIFDLNRFKQEIPESKMAVAIRLVTLPDHRSSTLPFRLMAEGVKNMVGSGVEYIFCTCQPHLIGMYQRLGFISYDVKVHNDPQFGIMVPLILLLGDNAHLKKVRSPLGSIIEKGSFNLSSLGKVKEALGNKSISDTGDKMHYEYLNSIGSFLNHPNREKALLFDGLTEEEVEEVIAAGHIIECAVGDQVIKKGQITKTVFVPLTGILHVRHKNHLIALIQTGEMLGELSFLLDGQRTADVFAGENGAKVLSLNSVTLRKLISKPGTISTHLLLNISTSLAIRLANTTASMEE